MKNPKNVARGRKARTSGRTFELKVRKDLEKQGWIIAKWQNDVDLESQKVIPARRQFNPFTKYMSVGNGVPDFICFKLVSDILLSTPTNSHLVNHLYEVIAVESKSTGYPSAEEKKKYDWYLQHKIFSKIFIASKSKKRGEIVYKEYVN